MPPEISVESPRTVCVLALGAVLDSIALQVSDECGLGFLVKAREVDTAPLIGRLALLKRSVVESAAEQQDTLELPFLLSSRLEFVFEGFVDSLLFHICLLCLIGTKAVRATAASGNPPHRTG